MEFEDTITRDSINQRIFGIGILSVFSVSPSKVESALSA